MQPRQRDFLENKWNNKKGNASEPTADGSGAFLKYCAADYTNNDAYYIEYADKARKNLLLTLETKRRCGKM